jgi:Spy/CpxP family protein refolding chaperone
MVAYRVAGAALALLALVAGAGRLSADEKKSEAGKRHDRLEALAHRLGLNDKQKEEIRKIHHEFDQKQDPLEHQLWSLHHEERERIGKVLTKEQRDKVPGVFREGLEKELNRVGAKLDLSSDQKEQIRKIHAKYSPKFRELAQHKGGEKSRGQFRHLRHEEFAEVRHVLNEEQRAKLPGVLRSEFRQWRDPAKRRQLLKAFADRIGLDDKQKDQVKKIHEEYDPKVQQLTHQIAELHKQEHEAMEKVLTAEQRTKLQELHKAHGGSSGKEKRD